MTGSCITPGPLCLSEARSPAGWLAGPRAAARGLAGHCPCGDLPQMSRHVHLHIMDVGAAAGGSDRGPPRGLAAQDQVDGNGHALDVHVKGAV